MFRIPVKLTTKEVLKLNACRSNNVRQLASQSSTSTPPPPPPKQPFDEEPRQAGLGSKLLLAVLGTTGITLAYAHSNPEFRKLLQEYIPWTEDALAIMDPDKFLGSWVTQVKDMASSASDMVFGESKPSKELSSSNILAPIPLSHDISNAPENKHSKMHFESDGPIQAPIEMQGTPYPRNEDPAKKKNEFEEPLKPDPIVNTKQKINEPPKEKEDSSAVAAKELLETKAAYLYAINVFKEYTKRVNDAMESCADTGLAKGLWEELKVANERKIEAETGVEEALKKLFIAVGDRARTELGSIRYEYEKSKAAADVASKYWPQVEEARKHFITELEAIFPRADINDLRLDTRGGDPDALLLVALKRVLLYQQRLAKVNCELTQKVDDSLRGLDNDVIKAKIEIELEKERKEWAILFQQKMAVSKAESDREMAAQLKRQMELFNLQLQDTLDQHALKVQLDERKQHADKLAAEKAAHGLQLATVLGRMQGVDQALKERSNADKMARHAQLLWAASEALEGVLRGRGTKSNRVSVAQELDAIATAAADSDELVTAVLRGVPAAAREKGVLSEVCLRERFIKVERVCRAVSLVPACGGHLYTFFLSWLQGSLLARAPPPTPAELRDEPTDFSKLDNYDILERARYFIERGQCNQALRYVLLLKGAAGTVARDWANEMALHLEARQAASALLAHASASGLLQL